MARASTFPLAPSVAIHSIPPVSSGYSHRLVVLPLSRALGQLCHSRPVVPAGAAALARVCGDHQFPRLHGAAGTTPLFSRGWWGLFSHSFPSCSLHGGGGGPGGSPSGGFSNFLPSGLDGERVGCSWRHLSPGRHPDFCLMVDDTELLAHTPVRRVFSRHFYSVALVLSHVLAPRGCGSITQLSVSPGANNFLPAGGHFRCRPVAARAHRSAVAITQDRKSVV